MLISNDFAKITAKASERITSEFEKRLHDLLKNTIFRLMFLLKFQSL